MPYNDEAITALVAILSRTPNLRVLGLGWPAGGGVSYGDLVRALALCSDLRHVSFGCGASLATDSSCFAQLAAWTNVRTLAFSRLTLSSAAAAAISSGLHELVIDGGLVEVDVLRHLMERLGALRLLMLRRLSNMTMAGVADVVRPCATRLRAFGITTVTTTRRLATPDPAFELELSRMRSLISLEIMTNAVHPAFWLGRGGGTLRALTLVLERPGAERDAELITISSALSRGAWPALEVFRIDYQQGVPKLSPEVTQVFSVRLHPRL